MTYRWQDVHDETVSLTLQLNMSEEQSHKLRTENAQLVQRYLARIGQEVETLNNKSMFS